MNRSRRRRRKLLLYRYGKLNQLDSNFRYTTIVTWPRPILCSLFFRLGTSYMPWIALSHHIYCIYVPYVHFLTRADRSRAAVRPCGTALLAPVCASSGPCAKTKRHGGTEHTHTYTHAHMYIQHGQNTDAETKHTGATSTGRRKSRKDHEIKRRYVHTCGGKAMERALIHKMYHRQHAYRLS